ncbi:unnamed protein product [Cladocopium goreaui]|uniref:Uncharacterized protein n=1 Tax=Cladocopium goreaui TaxID=2562237 RepID=A0A9P1CH60_9DINO|nr:unnamed protein product [Cladocopium goreaui]
MLGGGTLIKQAGLFGFGYNRVNYKFDQGQRWARFTAGRANELKRSAMFREDVSDLAAVSVSKLKVYVPVLTMSLGYVLTVLVEARSGLKFPGPPTFASGLYLNCLAVAFAFMTLSIWLCWHAAMRAQIAMVQLRTRKVRLPVPSQRQLDSARKILSTYEEQGVYDMFRLPFLMPNTGNTPPASDDEVKDGKSKKESKTGYDKAGLPGIGAKMKEKVKELAEETGGSKKELAHAARMPGTTSGVPSWIDKEVAARDDFPKASPSAFGNEAPPEPYEHFELIRQAQKDYWCAEAYARVTFLIGKMHLIQSFAYWLPIHNIGELGLVWGAVICASSLSAGVWIMFRMDVLPSHGGCFPIEIGGPIIEAISLALAYTHHPTASVIDISRAVAILVLLMQIGLTIRLYVVSQPANSSAGATHQAREIGERMFNQSASCESPAWLPAAFQHVSYLVAPPKTKAQLEQEQIDRDQNVIREDPMVNVDMTPWYYVRTLLFVTVLSWSVLLTGRIVECIMSERMLVTNPGAPPWTRIGRWYGWESGPITSKHYAHVTPMRGHFAWQKGWGPQGQQELWASDMFGFHPEADMHWSEAEGPEPHVGVAGRGKNTWFTGVIKYARVYEGGDHDWLDSGGHRRLQSAGATRATSVTSPAIFRPVVPAAIHWPPMLEPELLASSAHGIIAMAPGGTGAILPGNSAFEGGHSVPFNLGILEMGRAHGLSWSPQGQLLLHTSSGKIASCPVTAAGGSIPCQALDLPPVPGWEPSGIAVVTPAVEPHPFRAAILGDGKVRVHELTTGLTQHWHPTVELQIPHSTSKPVSLSGDHERLVMAMDDGSVFHWLLDGQRTGEAIREVPTAGPRRSWSCACATPSGRVMRLANKWRRHPAGHMEWTSELLL